MRLSHHFRIPIALAAGAVLLAGCGGDGDTAADTAADEPTPTEEATPVGADDDETDEGTAADDADDTETDDTETDDTETDETDDGADESPQSREFAELAQKGFASQARITYDRQVEDEATHTVVLSSDGEQTAWLMPEARMIARPDGTRIFCDESGERAQCFETSDDGQMGARAGASPFPGLAGAFQEGVEGLPDFASTGSEEIAGRSASCGTFDHGEFGTGEDLEAALCLDDETGIMLAYEVRDAEGAASSIEAVEVGEPRAGDFEPPAEPVRMDQGG